MTATGAGARTISRWWRGELVKPAYKKALDQAARRYRIMVPEARATATTEKTQDSKIAASA